MKIAIVHPSLKTKGGAENVVVWLAEELSKRGHQVDIYTTDYDEDFFGPKKSKKFNIYEMDLGGYKIDPLKWLSNGWKLRNRLTGYDFINPHNFPSYIWVYFAKKFNSKIPKVVWFCEEPVRPFYRDVIDEHVLKMLAVETEPQVKKPVTLRFLDKWRSSGIRIIPTVLKLKLRNSRDKLNLNIAKWLDKKTVLSLNLILTNSRFISDNIWKIFHIKATPCLLGIPVDRFREKNTKIQFQNFILTVSRLHYEKNLFNILRAVKILVEKKEFPVEKYVIAGTGPLYDKLARFIKELKIEKVVELLGFVSEKDLAELYAKTSLIVYLPLDETYGLIFPEAGLYSKPVIGPNQGGPREIVLDGQTGYQVDPLDPVQIAERIKLIFKDKKKLQLMGQKNRDFVTKELNFIKFTDRFLSVVRNKL